jgi:acylphosphatase
MKHFSIQVSGKVQGVFFRASAKEKADQFGIRGTVQNQKDGSVRIEAEGENEDLQRFLDWCREGPKFAQVDRCDVKEDVVKSYPDFSIRR